MLHTLFLRRWSRTPAEPETDPEIQTPAEPSSRWFRVMQAWSEVNDVYESESFGELFFCFNPLLFLPILARLRSRVEMRACE